VIHLASYLTGKRVRKGQALVEFALFAPALTVFVLLTVDVGRAYWESIDAAGASRAGVRMGIISDTADIGSAVRDEPNAMNLRRLADGTEWPTITGRFVGWCIGE